MFGLNFANPILLTGTALGLAPIIIHLLFKRRFRVVRWAAMKFLLASQRKNYRRIRLEQLILLIIRTLILVILALAITQPRLASSALGALGMNRPSRHVFIFMDSSFSMSYQVDGRSVFDQAKSVARQVVDSLKQGDKVTFFLVSEMPKGIIKEPSFDLRSVTDEIEAVTFSHTSADVPASLRQAVQLIMESASASKELYLINDFQRNSWHLKETAADTAFQKDLAEISKECEIFLIDVGRPNATNLAVTQVIAGGKIVLVGDVSSFEATVENFSTTEALKAVVNFYVDNRKQGTSSSTIQARNHALFQFNHVFRDSEPHVIRIETETDSLSLDDVRYLVVEPRETIRVLCIDGDLRAASDKGTTRYLKVALSPSGSEANLSPMSPEVVSPFALKPSSFNDYEVVVAANVALLTDEIVEALQHYVYNGGSLLLFSGGKSDIEFLNEKLYLDGKGLLPGRIVGKVTSDPNGEFFYFLQPTDFNHPILSMFKGLRTTPLTSVLVYQYLKVEVPDELGSTKVVTPYNSGDPAILEKKFGLGKVLFVTTSVDTEWTNLPQKPIFLPLVHESINYLIRGVNPRNNLLVGESYRRFLKPEEYSGKFSVTRTRQRGPLVEGEREDRPVNIAGIALGRQYALLFEETHRTGIYTVVRTDVESPVNYFCVNFKIGESDLQKISVESIQKALPDFKFLYSTETSDLRNTVDDSREATELWKSCLWMVLILVCLESFLAHRFGK